MTFMKRFIKNRDSLIDLQYSVIKIPLPYFIYKGLKEYTRKSNSYHPQPEELTLKISKKHNISKRKIMLTAGSDESILALANLYGNKTIIFTPTYNKYSRVKDFNGKLRMIKCIKRSCYQIPPKKYEDTTLIFIANPNNPFGVTQKNILKKIIEKNPNTIIVIDETYGKFCNISMVADTSNYKNLIVLKSFSKDFGMAGIRLGYVLANEKIIKNLKKVIQVSNVSYLSVGAAMLALDNEWYFDKLIDSLIKERKGFYHFLLKQNFNVIDSNINVAVIKFGSNDESSKFVEYLKKSSILVKSGNGKGNIGLNDSYVRIVIGNKQQMKITKSVIKNYIYESK